MDRSLWFAAPYAHAPADWLETPNAHIFKVDLPGMSKKDVQVHIHDDHVLEINGELKNPEEKGAVTWHAAERSHGRFLRRFQLPDNVQLDDVKAVIESGVLTITILKKPQGKLGRKHVPVISKL